MGIGARIKEVLKEQNKTIAWLAKESGVSKNTLYTITKRDNTKVRQDILEKISKTLGVKLEYLLGLDPSDEEITGYVADSIFSLSGYYVYHEGKDLYRIFNNEEGYYFYANQNEIDDILGDIAFYINALLGKLMKNKKIYYEGKNE